MTNQVCVRCDNKLPTDAHGLQKYCDTCLHPYCIDCGKELAESRAIRCRSCAAKDRHIRGIYGESCRQKISRSMIDAHEQGCYGEEWRQKMSKAQKKAQNRPNVQQRRSRSLKDAHKRGDFSSKITQRRRSEANKAARKRGCYGTPEEIQQKMSEIARAAHKRGCYDSEETRRKKSESLVIAHKRGDFSSEDTRQKISEGLKAAHERGCFDGVFQSPTSIEIAVANALDKLSLKHQSQFRPDNCSYIYDEFIFPGILIEVNGNYWHSLPKQRKIDKKKASWAKDNNYCLVTIWEHEIHEHGAEFLIEERILPMVPAEFVVGA